MMAWRDSNAVLENIFKKENPINFHHLRKNARKCLRCNYSKILTASVFSDL